MKVGGHRRTLMDAPVRPRPLRSPGQQTFKFSNSRRTKEALVQGHRPWPLEVKRWDEQNTETLKTLMKTVSDATLKRYWVLANHRIVLHFDWSTHWSRYLLCNGGSNLSFWAEKVNENIFNRCSSSACLWNHADAGTMAMGGLITAN